MIRFRAVALLEVVFSDMQLEKLPVCIAEPAQRAGRIRRVRHVVLLFMSMEARHVGGPMG
jgi:hypothetical protein